MASKLGTFLRKGGHVRQPKSSTVCCPFRLRSRNLSPPASKHVTFGSNSPMSGDVVSKIRSKRSPSPSPTGGDATFDRLAHRSDASRQQRKPARTNTLRRRRDFISRLSGWIGSLLIKCCGQGLQLSSLRMCVLPCYCVWSILAPGDVSLSHSFSLADHENPDCQRVFSIEISHRRSHRRTVAARR